MKKRSALLEFIQVVVIAALIIFPIRIFVGSPFYVQGSSMEPNYHEGDYLIVDKISYRFDEPKRGDVIVLKSPIDTSYYIKRIIGLPGEKVVINNGDITIFSQGEQLNLNEEYLNQNIYTNNTVDNLLSEDEYFVLGDNRPVSFDSRLFGPIQKTDIVGKIFVRLFPLNQDHVSKPINY